MPMRGVNLEFGAGGGVRGGETTVVDVSVFTDSLRSRTRASRQSVIAYKSKSE